MMKIYSLKTKRALIQGSLLFYTQMGTPAAVNRIIETIFETGYIEEWYEYDGDPHHFRAYVGDGGEVGPGGTGGVPAGPVLCQAPFVVAG